MTVRNPRFLCSIPRYTIHNWSTLYQCMGTNCRIEQELINYNSNVLNLVNMSHNFLWDSFFQHDFERYFREIRIEGSSKDFMSNYDTTADRIFCRVEIMHMAFCYISRDSLVTLSHFEIIAVAVRSPKQRVIYVESISRYQYQVKVKITSVKITTRTPHSRMLNVCSVFQYLYLRPVLNDLRVAHAPQMPGTFSPPPT